MEKKTTKITKNKSTKTTMDNQKMIRNILREELIGFDAQVISSTNAYNTGINGIITDETKHTIQINDKRLFKKDIMLRTNGMVINGQLLVGKPHDRVKQL